MAVATGCPGLRLVVLLAYLAVLVEVDVPTGLAA
jgi:hypothetical protein